MSTIYNFTNENVIGVIFTDGNSHFIVKGIKADNRLDLWEYPNEKLCSDAWPTVKDLNKCLNEKNWIIMEIPLKTISSKNEYNI